ARAPEAALGFDPRLGAGGRASMRLERGPIAEVWHGQAEIVPNRRGTGALHALWLRWPGPLGLAYRQAHRALDRDLRVWPDLSPVRSPSLQAFLRSTELGL